MTDLTKREYFAALIMQALATTDVFPDRIAQKAVEYADALLEALAGKPP